MRITTLPNFLFLTATKVVQLCVFFLICLVFIYARVRVKGISNLKKYGGNVIFAANHANELDPLLICYALARAHILQNRLPIIFLSREKTFYGDMGFLKAFLYGGFFFRLLGAYPVTPKDERVREELLHNTLRTHITLLKLGYPVLIFPEGTRSHTGKILPAKAGVIILSEESGVPIVPIAIKGTLGLLLDELVFGKKEVRITIGDPIYPKNNSRDEHPVRHPPFRGKRALVRKARNVVMARIKEMLRDEAEQK